MKKITLTLAITCFFLTSIVLAQEKYKRVKISNVSENTISQLDNLGIDLTCGVSLVDNAMTLEISNSNLTKIKQRGIGYDVLIKDLTKFYSERAIASLPQAAAEVAQAQMQRALQRSFSVAEVINNVGQYDECDEIDWAVPSNWNLNDPTNYPSETNHFGGCLTYDMVLDELDDMRTLYPNLISAKTDASPGGSTPLTTVEGRTIYYVRISDNPDTDESNEPETLYQSLIHSRESATVMNQLYFMWYLLENYDSDPAIKNLVNNHALYFIPVLNPDGFVHNQTIAPDGGGLQRKNRRIGTTNCGITATSDDYGVDLNRNSAYYWGNGGADNNQCGQVYYGTGPFSEPETQILRDFFLNHDFKIALNHHSFKNAMLHAYAGTSITNPRPDEYSKYNHDMTYYNRYAYGPSTSISGLNSGNMNDWMLGGPAGTSANGTPTGTGSGKNTLAWTPENGLSSESTIIGSGFWPDPTNFMPIAKRAMRMNFLAAYYSGKYAKLHDLNQNEITTAAGGSGNFQFAIENLGQNGNDTTPNTNAFTLTVTAVSGNVTINTATATENFTAAEILAQKPVNISYTLDPGIQANDEVTFKVVLTNDYASDNVLYEANITKYYQPTVLFSDSGDDFSNWTATTGTWSITSNAYSGNAITTNTSFPYSNGDTKELELDSPVNLSGITTTLIQYYAKWDLERSFDYVQLEGSTNGTNWTPLCGKLTKPGAPDANNTYSATSDAGDSTTKFNSDRQFQPDAEPLYDGDTQGKWNMEEVVIDATTNSFLYNQSAVYLRFQFRTDSSNRKDSYANADFEGFTFDEFKIMHNATGLNQTITFNALSDKFTTDADFTVSATASSGLPVTYSIVSGPATISGNTISLTGSTGTVVVRASQGGDGTYDAAPDVDQSFEVTVEPPCSGILVDTYPYSESFEGTGTGGLGGWTQDAIDNFDWTINNGGTPTNNTGPNSTSDGTFYLYTEANDANDFETAILNSPCFDLTGRENSSFSFKYYMFGSQLGSLSLEVSNDDGSTWTNLTTISGEQQTTSGQAWFTFIEDLSAYDGGYIKLRFIGEIGNINGQATSDIAIDAINLTSDLASVTPIADCKDISISLDASGNATIVASDIDNGGSVGDLSIDISSFECSNIGTVNVTLTATDPGNASNTDSCVAVVTVNQQTAPTPTNCWDNYVYNNSTCQWENTGTQPTEPATECWETATFNDTTCSWDVTGTQPAEPATECWETATFNDTTCSWDVTGTQPAEPATECWETATFNDTTCSWDVTGTQPAEPATECWETATFNDTTCSWDVTGTQPAEPATECWETATFNDTTCSWDVTGTQPAEPATECWETATFNDTTCSWDVTGTQPAEPATECWETATFNDTTCSWDVTGTQPAEPATECWETATFNDTTCSWDVTGTQPAEPATECWETATFNDTTCSWDVTGTQPAEPATECWETATFNDTTCSWDVTGTQPAEPATECWETATFNDTTCSWDVTGTQPAEPATECWETATFNDTTCSWDVTGTQPAEPATECWETATFNDTTCSWDVTGTQPAEPATECWETATFNDTTCSWDVTGTQPAEPATECWETATFNDTTCSWDVTGTQPAEPATECWETATFNDTTCSWDVTGTQPAEPATECWETATFNDTTCSWDVTGTQPAEPATECWETATFNDTTCSWDVTGTQPAEPATECWETATFNDTTCSWDVTGTQPAEPATECWETATFNDTTCSWDVTGTQPAEPATECWETATFNDTTCSWDVTGTQPAEPATECWETATFNDTTCSWDVTGTQPAEPATECWETATFNDTTCSWDVTGTQPAEPATECWETATFNDTTCSWDVTGTQPAEPATECWETATFNDTTCSWDVTGTQPAEPATECWETATFNDTTCSWDVTGTQPAEPATECWETATFNDTTCSWDVTGTQPAEPATECWETATFNDTTCSWDVTGTQPAEPATECWETATFNDTTCSWDVTGTQPAEPATECWETATFNDTTCSWDVTGTQPAEPATECWETATFNDTTCSWDVTGTQPAEPATECWETATFNDTTCSWDVTGTQPAEPATECWETATFNDTTCSWDVTGTQPAEPATECWETATFNDTTCSWDVTGTQPAEPATECWETATFNDTTCSWDVTGTQPAEPATECWETATFNDTTCSWDVTGTQPAEPATECWETATFNDTTCSWDVTGTQPAEPATECWETATFNDTTCSWDVTGTQPAEPATECWETATFNDTTCSWDVTGTQPAEPATECWETATFNDTTCSWDVTGTPTIYYADTDGDGYGDINNTINDCTLPTGYVSDNTDCDDSDDTINPGAFDIPDNGIDEDCSGSDNITLSNDDKEIGLFSISPNPFNDRLKIIIPTKFAQDPFKISIYDLNGRTVYTLNSVSVNGVINLEGLNKLEQAPYLIKVLNTKTGNVINKRLIKY